MNILIKCKKGRGVYVFNSLSSLLLSRNCRAVFSFHWSVRALGYGVGGYCLGNHRISRSFVLIVNAVSLKSNFTFSEDIEY